MDFENKIDKLASWKNILKCTDRWCILVKWLGTGYNIIHAFSFSGSFILREFERIALT